MELGYHGIGKPGGIPSKIMSKDSSILNSKHCVNDHLLGATEVGSEIHKVFKKNNYDIDWMLKEWLFENLYLWGTVKVTKEEHKSNNILRNSDQDNNLYLNLHKTIFHKKKINSDIKTTPITILEKVFSQLQETSSLNITYVKSNRS